MGRKPDGRKPRVYTPAGPPAAGVTVEQVDAHTLLVRSADPVPEGMTDVLVNLWETVLRHPSIQPGLLRPGIR